MSSFVDFDPASEAVEIAQNVRTIMNTPKLTVPMHRALGVDASWVDAPITRAIALIRKALIDAITEFEPRVGVVSVDFTGDASEGQLTPTITYRITGTGETASV